MTIRAEGLDDLARDLGAAASRALVSVARGKSSVVANAMAKDAKQRARAQWTKGYATGATANSIRARMSRDRSQVRGFLFMEGGGVYQEIGTSRGSSPVLGPAARAREGDWADAVAEAAEQFLT